MCGKTCLYKINITHISNHSLLSYRREALWFLLVVFPWQRSQKMIGWGCCRPPCTRFHPGTVGTDSKLLKNRRKYWIVWIRWQEIHEALSTTDDRLSSVHMCTILQLSFQINVTPLKLYLPTLENKTFHEQKVSKNKLLRVLYSDNFLSRTVMISKVYRKIQTVL